MPQMSHTVWLEIDRAPKKLLTSLCDEWQKIRIRLFRLFPHPRLALGVGVGESLEPVSAKKKIVLGEFLSTVVDFKQAVTCANVLQIPRRMLHILVLNWQTSKVPQ